MPANSNKLVVGYLAGKYPGWLGHLYSPDGFRGPYEFLPFALDNGRFPAWSSGKPWSEDAWRKLLDDTHLSQHRPLWVLVPDVVGDRDETLREWDKWHPTAGLWGWPLAFALQDGMVPADVPANADVLFLGGSTKWKRATLYEWGDFARSRCLSLHVGRVNTERWLWECLDAGAESCDGTGWFRGDPVQTAGLMSFLERATAGLRPRQRLLRDA